MVGRRRTRNVNQLHEEPDPRDIKLHDFSQRDLSMADYTKEFNHLMLNEPFISYSDVYKLAPKVEKQLKEKEGQKSTTYSVSRGPSRGYVTNQASGSQSTKSVVTKASQTPQTHDVGAGPYRTKPKSVECFKCKGFGHISSDCLNQWVFTMEDRDSSKYNKEESNLFISKSGFSEALQQSKVVYALVIKEVGDENPKLPDVLLLLLDQFQCIFPNEIPAGLPLMRNVQHCIDLVQRATLPNKTAYQMNPTKNVKLQKQVDELLKKGMTEGQNKTVNHSFGNLLKCLVGDNIRQWDLVQPQAEFAYNRSSSQTTIKIPFEVVCGCNPLRPLDLVPLPINLTYSGDGDERARAIKELHEKVMVAPTILVSAEENLRDPIDIKVDIIPPEPIAAVVFPAATVVVGDQGEATDFERERERANRTETEGITLYSRVRSLELIETCIYGIVRDEREALKG
uniref:RNA-directed DNA polymerase n=1 Tax=Tanacetum cinerariifolium TaxID=118510 RepID=A0A6L2MK26_TANCI|nr:RNA-directed DNA polymerase [Tanacetum cinerariifolium]